MQDLYFSELNLIRWTLYVFTFRNDRPRDGDRVDTDHAILIRVYTGCQKSNKKKKLAENAIFNKINKIKYNITKISHIMDHLHVIINKYY